MKKPRELSGRLGRYVILRPLGAGGMGAVYLAEDSKLGRKVALKVPHLADADSPALERFRREARLAASIDHPNLCPLYDVEEIEGVLFFTMPFIDGKPLVKLIERGTPWPPNRAAELVRKLAGAVASLHAHGIVHRDLKPANVMLRASGEPVVMDFGLARSFATRTKQLTKLGRPIGTPSYMAPEQVAASSRMGPTTDVYGLGVILYELLTGELPFGGALGSVFYQILNVPPAAPSSRANGIGPRLEAACLKALNKAPDERFASAAAFEAELAAATVEQVVPTAVPTVLVTPVSTPTEAFGFGAPTRSAAGGAGFGVWIAGGVAALLLLGLLLFFAGHKEPPAPEPETTSPVATLPTPSLRLRLPDSEKLLIGARTRVKVRLERKHLRGDVQIALSEASPGIRVVNGTIPAGFDIGAVELDVDAGLLEGQRTLLFVAIGQVTSDPIAMNVALVFRAEPPTLTPSQPALTLELERSTVTLDVVGVRVKLGVKVTRENCPGTVELVGASPGLSLSGAALDKDANAGVLTLAIATPETVALGKRTIVLTARCGDVESKPVELEVTIQHTQLGKEFTNRLGMKLVLIRAGKFHMGTPGDEWKQLLTAPFTAPFYKHEGPQHEVEITRDFYLGATEVTVGQFTRFNPARKQGEPSFPIVHVDWNDAVAFCKWLSVQDNKLYELPTEAEWEYACRAGTTTAYHFGAACNGTEANCDGTSPYGTTVKGPYRTRTSTVMSYKPNAWGLFDMHGNVREWCQDGRRVYAAKAVKDPLGDSTGSQRVLRGGGWNDLASGCRASFRSEHPKDYHQRNVGFRVVCRPGKELP